MRAAIVLGILFFALINTGCEEDAFCGDSSRRFVLLSFYDHSDSLYAFPVQLVGIEGLDSLILGDTVQLFALPLNPATNSTRFTINWSDPTVDSAASQFSDELELFYTTRTGLVSPSCGINQQILLDTGFTTFDSLQFQNKLLDAVSTLDIRVYFSVE